MGEYCPFRQFSFSATRGTWLSGTATKKTLALLDEKSRDLVGVASYTLFASAVALANVRLYISRT
jgi:hypothetical protein